MKYQRVAKKIRDIREKGPRNLYFDAEFSWVDESKLNQLIHGDFHVLDYEFITVLDRLEQVIINQKLNQQEGEPHDQRNL